MRKLWVVELYDRNTKEWLPTVTSLTRQGAHENKDRDEWPDGAKLRVVKYAPRIR